MVQDTRVSHQLARLGGVYRDPARVNRDASALLKSSVGAYLNPIAAVHVDDTGTRTTVLVLQGTIAIHYRSNTYQLLMDMYMVPGYPHRPPICYVRLAPQMYLKEHHKHVGSDGKVYLPYLSEWNAASHNLVELTVAMSSVFSADPPVFSRSSKSGSSTASTAATTAATTTTTQQQQPPPFSQSLSSSSYAASTQQQQQQTPPMNSWRAQQQQLEALMAKEAAEANAAAETARLAEQREREQEQRAAQEIQTLQQRATVRVTNYLHEQARLTQQYATDDARDAQQLELYPLSKLQDDVRKLREHKERLEQQTHIVDTQTEAIQAWIHAARSSQQSKKQTAKQTADDDDTPVDELVAPVSAIHAQMLDLAAENAAIADALYNLDAALFRQDLQSEAHLKLVRQLAKQQFYVRAHLLKISQHHTQQQSSRRL